MVFEPEDGTLDRDVDASMRMFERSQVGPAPLIHGIMPSRVLLVLDGSPQDITSIDAANYLAERFELETFVLHPIESKESANDQDATLAKSVADSMKGAKEIESPEGDAYDTILTVIGQNEIDLVILPSPFGRSFENVGVDSIGTVLDVLLARCPVPILVIRREDQTLQACVQRVSMVVGGECDVEHRAAGWIFGLAGESANLALNLVVEKEEFENLRSIIEAIKPGETVTEQQVSDALAKSHQVIHGAMAKTAGNKGMGYELKPVAGEVAPPNPLNDHVKQLLVMPLEVDDRFGQGFVHDRIRRSPHPVLVVPGHVPELVQ